MNRFRQVSMGAKITMWATAIFAVTFIPGLYPFH